MPLSYKEMKPFETFLTSVRRRVDTYGRQDMNSGRQDVTALFRDSLFVSDGQTGSLKLSRLTDLLGGPTRFRSSATNENVTRIETSQS